MPPKVIYPDPRTIIPYHDSSPTAYFVSLYQRRLFEVIQPIPVVKAPKDLMNLGKYINYNGHHRTKSAILARVRPRAWLIQNDDDIEFLATQCEIYKEIIEGFGKRFKEHYELVCAQAKYYAALKEGKLSVKELVQLAN